MVIRVFDALRKEGCFLGIIFNKRNSLLSIKRVGEMIYYLPAICLDPFLLQDPIFLC